MRRELLWFKMCTISSKLPVGDADELGLWWVRGTDPGHGTEPPNVVRAEGIRCGRLALCKSLVVQLGCFGLIARC